MTGTKKMLELADELETLIREYSIYNSDWPFRRGVMLDVLGKLRTASNQLTRTLDLNSVRLNLAITLLPEHEEAYERAIAGIESLPAAAPALTAGTGVREALENFVNQFSVQTPVTGLCEGKLCGVFGKPPAEYFFLVAGNSYDEMVLNHLAGALNLARSALAALPPAQPSSDKSAAQISELDDASNACLELAAEHGLATGHGDTVGDMIREFSGQLRGRAAKTLDRPDGGKPKSSD